MLNVKQTPWVLLIFALMCSDLHGMKPAVTSTVGWDTETNIQVLGQMAAAATRQKNYELAKKITQRAASLKAGTMLPAGYVPVEKKKLEEQEKKLDETTKKLLEAEKKAAGSGSGTGSGGAAAGEAEALEVLQKILGVYEPDIYAALKIANLLAPLAGRTELKIIDAVAKIKTLLKKQTDDANAGIITIDAITSDDSLLKSPVDLSNDAKPELKNLKDFILFFTLLELLGDKTNQTVIDNLKIRFKGIIADDAAYDKFAKEFIEKAIGMKLYTGTAPIIVPTTPTAAVIEKIKWQDCIRIFDFINYDICTAHQAGTTNKEIYGLNIKKALEENFKPSALVELLAKNTDKSNLDAKYNTSFTAILEKIFEELQSGSLAYDELYKKFIASKPAYFKGINDLVSVVGTLADIENFPSSLSPEDVDIFKEFITNLLLIKKPKIDLDTLNFRQKLEIAGSIDKILGIMTLNFLDAIDIAMLHPKVFTQDQFVGAVKFKETSIKLLLKEPWRISDSNMEMAVGLMYGVKSKPAQVATITPLMNNYFKTQDLSVQFVLEHIAYIPGLTQASCLAMIESLKLLPFKNSVVLSTEIDDLLALLAASDIDGAKKKYPELSDEIVAKLGTAFAKKSTVKAGPAAAVKTLAVPAQNNFIDIIKPLLANIRVTRDLVTALSKKHTTSSKRAPQDLELLALLKSNERMVKNILRKIQSWIDESTDSSFYKALPSALYQMLEPYYFLSRLSSMIEHNDQNVKYDAKSKAIERISSDTIVRDLSGQISKLLSPSGEEDLVIYSAYDALMKELALCVNEDVFLNEFGGSPSYRTDQEKYLAHKFTLLIAEQMLQFTDPEVFLYQQDWQDFIFKGIDAVDLLKDTTVNRKNTQDKALSAYEAKKAAWEPNKIGPPPMKPPANWAPVLEIGQDVNAEYASWIDKNKDYFQAIAKIIKANTKPGAKISALWYLNLSFNEKKIDFNKVLKIIEYALVKNRFDKLQEFIKGISDASLSIPGVYVVDESLDPATLKATLLFYKNLKSSAAFKALKSGLNGVSFDLKTFAIGNVSTLEMLADDVGTEMRKILTSPDKASVVENEKDFESFIKRQVLRAIYIAKNPKIDDLTNILSDSDFNNPIRMKALEPDFSKLPAAPAAKSTIKPGKGSIPGGATTTGGLSTAPLKKSVVKDDYDSFLDALSKVNKSGVQAAIAKLSDINPLAGKEHPIMKLCRGSALVNKETVTDLLDILKDKGFGFAHLDANGNTILQQVILESSKSSIKESYLVPIVNYLIDVAKVDIDHQNDSKDTVLHILAAETKPVESLNKPIVLKIIKQARADIANASGSRALEISTLVDNTLFIKELLENKNKGDVPFDGDAISFLIAESDSLKAGFNAPTWNDILLLLRDKFGVDIIKIDPLAAAALALATSTTKTSGISTDPFQLFLNNLGGGKYLQAKNYLDSESNILGTRSAADQSKVIETLFGLEFGKKITLAQVKDMLAKFKNAGINFKAVLDANNNNALHLLCQKDILFDHTLLVADINAIIVLLCDDDNSIVLDKNTAGQAPLHVLVGGKFLDALKNLDKSGSLKFRQDTIVNNVESMIKKLQSYGDAKSITDSNGKTPLKLITDKQTILGIDPKVVQKITKLLT